ncbi:MAG: hypothetical protein HYX92_00970 [Chloroflexi bacterium]|nr:hypothetical protein [Chloroflexota bacterium]
MGELETAFDDASPVVSYFLDTETGEVLRITDETNRELEEILEDLDEDLIGEERQAALEKLLDERDLDDWEREELLDADRVESDRFIRVPEAHEGYGDMEEFIATVRSERLRELLEVAINGRGAFRRFKDVLTRDPEERERWFKFKSDRVRERIVAWLEEEGIEPVP